MSSTTIYFDCNASAPPLPEVRAAIARALESGLGNPSSNHGAGARARTAIADAREALAEMVGCQLSQVIFCSGATEANNMVLKSAAGGDPSEARIITSSVEHSSVVQTCEWLAERGAAITYLPVDGNGLIDLYRLEKALKDKTDLVSIQWANNETGCIQPVEEIAALCRRAGVAFHSDGAQVLGRLPIAPFLPNFDFLTFSAHKVHGPQGVGALIARDPALVSPLIHGGPQESRHRAGTENVPGIVGFGAAIRHRLGDFDFAVAHMTQLRNDFEKAILARVAHAKVNARGTDRLCNTSNISFDPLDGQALVARLDIAGICCSQSSACTSSFPEPSYVLRAMGLNADEAFASIRFSFSVLNTPDEVAEATQHIEAIARQLGDLLLSQPGQLEARP